MRQVDAKKKRGRPRGGNREFARLAGMSEAGVRRARKVASLSPEAQEAAKRLHLDSNQSALIAAARYSFAKDQVAVLEEWGKPLSPEEINLKNWNRLVDAWNRASWQNQVKFKSNSCGK
jgi:hypothetical protein